MHFTPCAFKEFAYFFIVHRLNFCFRLEGKEELSRFVESSMSPSRLQMITASESELSAERVAF